MSIALEPAVEQLRLLRARKLSPLELAEEHIRRIERLNPALNAIIGFEAERVRSQARHPAAGPLHGLPITIKSCIAVDGYPCEVGSTLWRGEVAEKDAVAVRRLRASGAVVLGITNCPEFLMAYESDNLLYGRTNNPWDLTRTSGGSSGGEAAAIAAGLSTGGLGSDSGGSVREPAHFSGICALKPTAGRISTDGHRPPCIGPFSTLGAIGPMARTIVDVALLFQAATGHDAMHMPDRSVKYRHCTLEQAKQIPIGWFETDALMPVTKATRQAVRAAAETLAKRGFAVEEIRPPRSLESARKLWDLFFVQCGLMFYEPTIVGHRDALSPVFQNFVQIAESRTPLTEHSLLRAWADLDEVRATMIQEMQSHPLLLTPVCSVPAFRHHERSWMIDGKGVEYLDAMRFMQWFNLLGAPAAVVPVGRSPEGLPIGVQIAGVPYADELVLTVAGAIDAAFGYQPPPLALG